MILRFAQAAMPRRPAAQAGASSEPLAPSAYRIQAMVEGVDQIAAAMERKWGVGRLRLLVSDLLRAKFDEQRDRLDAAIAANDETLVRVQVEGMRRAWETLERSALEAGEKPIAPEVWECVLTSTGEVVSLVRTEAEAHHVAREGRVFTVVEIATLIEGLGDTVLEAKKQFPGATVTGIRRKAPIDWALGDELPF